MYLEWGFSVDLFDIILEMTRTEQSCYWQTLNMLKMEFIMIKWLTRWRKDAKQERKISLSILAKHENNLVYQHMSVSRNDNEDQVKNSKNYGIWFGKLMPFVSPMHSWKPQQAIEPSNIEQLETTESTDESPQSNSTDDTNTK